MPLIQSFITGLSTQLQGRAPLSSEDKQKCLIREICKQSICDLGNLFSFILPLHKMQEASHSARNRIYNEIVTFWAWFGQILEGNQSCTKAVAMVQSWCKSADVEIPSAGSSAFCRARQRLSLKFLDKIEGYVQSFTRKHLREGQLWHGLYLKAVDSTSFKLSDEEANQKEYPQPSAQKKGCGFPVMYVTGVLCLATGQFIKSLAGKRTHDARSLFQLLPGFGKGDVVLADRAYCSYTLIYLLLQQGAHSIMRLHQARNAKQLWKSGKKLGQSSRLVTLRKSSKLCRCGISQEQWDTLPREMEVRLVKIIGKDRHGKRKTMYVVTTLLCPLVYTDKDIGEAYASRWLVEVKFRDIKTTLGMEMIRVKSPEMARKTLRMILLSYNLVKVIQLEALYMSDICIDHLSLKGTTDLIMEFRVNLRGTQDKPQKLKDEYKEVLKQISGRLFRIRPGRSEPRVIKSRPKPFQYLSEPRGECKEILHRGKYRKAA